ncbi:Uncharacterised protein [Mycobacteroides abscessus subsp. abscessus]|nr:Uncharacterised protein [Mycobacteroides abscessus subsp. abscessus]
MYIQAGGLGQPGELEGDHGPHAVAESMDGYAAIVFRRLELGEGARGNIGQGREGRLARPILPARVLEDEHVEICCRSLGERAVGRGSGTGMRKDQQQWCIG